MKAAWYERNGPAREVLQVGEMPDPEPGPGEVRVQVHASGLNPSDWKTRTGSSRRMGFPRVIPHSDGAGVIDRVGGGVPTRRVGERVWIWNAQWKRPYGTAAEFVVLPAPQAVSLPSNVGFEVGACLGIPALTAHRAVTCDGPVAGQSVLVSGGAGAVGRYAIQFSKLLGAAQVIATVSSAEKAGIARSAGADLTIDYKTEAVAERVMQATGGRGVDRVVEVDVAGNAELLPKVVAQDGLCVAYGSNAPAVTFGFLPMILRGAAVRFFIVYELADADRNRGIADIAAWLEAGQVSHLPIAVYPLEDIVEAHEHAEAGNAPGKIVLAPR
jgi:NADPH2:quinone reductase